KIAGGNATPLARRREKEREDHARYGPAKRNVKFDRHLIDHILRGSRIEPPHDLQYSGNQQIFSRIGLAVHSRLCWDLATASIARSEFRACCRPGLQSKRHAL